MSETPIVIEMLVDEDRLADHDYVEQTAAAFAEAARRVMRDQHEVSPYEGVAR